MPVFEVGNISLQLDIPAGVYAPSDDTQMLAEAALREIVPLAMGRPIHVLEIGCGSGAVSLALAKAGKCKSIMACDISEEAVKAAKRNAAKNKIKAKIEFVVSNLFSAIPTSKKFDFILFNPPYLPTAATDKVKGKLNAALDGGKDGLKTVQPFLERAGAHMNKGGRILLVVSSLQPKERLVEIIESHRLAHKILAEQSFFFEKLQIWMVWKPDS